MHYGLNPIESVIQQCKKHVRANEWLAIFTVERNLLFLVTNYLRIWNRTLSWLALINKRVGIFKLLFCCLSVKLGWWLFLAELRNVPEIKDRNQHLKYVLEHLGLLVENENAFVHKGLNDLYYSHLFNVNRISDSHIENDWFKYCFGLRCFLLLILSWRYKRFYETSSLFVHQLQLDKRI